MSRTTLGRFDLFGALCILAIRPLFRLGFKLLDAADRDVCKWPNRTAGDDER